MTKSIRDGIALSLFGMILLGSTALAPAALAQETGADAPLADYAAAEDPPVFDTPELAVEAFKQTVNGGDFDKLAALLGLDPVKTRSSEGVMETYDDIKEGVKEKVAVEDVEGRKVVEIGDELWPFPFPISKGDDGKWAFDTFVGLEEIANRRVGDNELATLATMRAYVGAQEEYGLGDHDGDGVLEYAQKLISDEGAQDGLYWPAEKFGGEESPAAAALAGGDALDRAKAGQGFQGYRYRILTGQGDNIAGGEIRLCHQRQHDRRVRPGCLAGEIRRHRSEDLRRQSQRHRLRGGSRRGYREDGRRHPHVQSERRLGGRPGLRKGGIRIAKRKTVQYGGNISEYYAADGRPTEQVNADKTSDLVQDARECTGVASPFPAGAGIGRRGDCR